MEENKIIIATLDVDKALYIIAKEAVIADRIEIQFTEKYAPTIEYLLRILRKAFGWLEDDRGEKKSYNNKCVFNQRSFCTHSKNLKEKKQSQLKCTEPVRKACKYYQQKYAEPIQINYVIISKAGGIRGL